MRGQLWAVTFVFIFKVLYAMRSAGCGFALIAAQPCRFPWRIFAIPKEKQTDEQPILRCEPSA
jgi:hypothetical protein